jgi:hypothetical protein
MSNLGDHKAVARIADGLVFDGYFSIHCVLHSEDFARMITGGRID